MKNLTELNFQALVEATPNAIVLVNKEGKIAYVNSQTEKLFGYIRSELVGQPVERLIPERFAKGHPSLRESFYQAPKVRLMGEGRELFALRKDGSEFPIEIGLNPVITVDGMLVLASIIDITERKKADERFRMLVEYSPSALLLVDKDGIIQMINTKLEELFGYAKEELVKNKLENLIPKNVSHKHPQLRKGYFDSPEPRSMGTGRDLYAKRKDGTDIPVEIGLNPIETEEGKMVLASIIDISQRKENEGTIKKQISELEIKNRELEQFAYIASHDLQEPLKTINSFTLRLKKQITDTYKLDERSEKCLDVISGASARMSSLVTGLLGYSRLGPKNEYEDVNFNDLFGAISQDLHALIEESGATFTVGKLPTIKGSPNDLRLLLQNLIANGIKFCLPNRAPHIEIQATPKKSAWHFSVRDNGIGIKEEHFDKIFTIFQRLHTEKEYAGTGIGLANCKKVVQIHQGEIWVDSVPGEGSTFHFTISTDLIG